MSLHLDRIMLPVSCQVSRNTRMRSKLSDAKRSTLVDPVLSFSNGLSMRRAERFHLYLPLPVCAVSVVTAFDQSGPPFAPGMKHPSVQFES
jgi:hypothetical protein